MVPVTRSHALMNRRKFLRLSLASGALGYAAPALTASALRVAAFPAARPFELDEATLTQLQDGLARGKYSSVSLVKKYLARIEEIDRRGPKLNSIIELNPDAVAIAGPGCGAAHSGRARSPPRNSGADQGQHQYP